MVQLNPLIKHAIRERLMPLEQITEYAFPDQWEHRSRINAQRMFSGDYIPGNNDITYNAVHNYLKVLGELRITIHGAVTVPLFHCQYSRRISQIGQVVEFVVPTQKFV